MQFAIMQCFEIGMHQTLFYFESPLCIIFWVCLLMGIGVQLLLQKKAKRRWGRRVFAGLLIPGLLACELGCQVITGWDLLIPMVLYFYLLTMLIGAALCALVFWLRRRAV